MARGHWIETPEAKALRIARLKATWAKRKQAKTYAPAAEPTVEPVPSSKETTKPAPVRVGEHVRLEIEGQPRPFIVGRIEPEDLVLLPNRPIALVSKATATLAEVDAISVGEIETALSTVAECDRAALALEQMVDKCEGLISLVRHCRRLLAAKLDRPEEEKETGYRISGNEKSLTV